MRARDLGAGRCKEARDRARAIEFVVAHDIDHRLRKGLQGPFETHKPHTDIACEDMNIAVHVRQLPARQGPEFEVDVGEDVQSHEVYVWRDRRLDSGWVDNAAFCAARHGKRRHVRASCHEHVDVGCVRVFGLPSHPVLENYTDWRPDIRFSVFGPNPDADMSGTGPSFMPMPRPVQTKIGGYPRGHLRARW